MTRITSSGTRIVLLTDSLTNTKHQLNDDLVHSNLVVLVLLFHTNILVMSSVATLGKFGFLYLAVGMCCEVSLKAHSKKKKRKILMFATVASLNYL